MQSNFFYTHPEQRVFSWRACRDELAETDNPLHTISQWASSAPMSSHIIDCWDCTNWPTAWELVDGGIYCEFSIALLIGYTLSIAFPDVYNLEIVLIENKDENFFSLCVRVDEKYLLNYSAGEVVFIDDIICSSLKTHAIFKLNDENHFEIVI